MRLRDVINGSPHTQKELKRITNVPKESRSSIFALDLEQFSTLQFMDINRQSCIRSMSSIKY